MASTILNHLQVISDVHTSLSCTAIYIYHLNLEGVETMNNLSHIKRLVSTMLVYRIIRYREYLGS